MSRRVPHSIAPACALRGVCCDRYMGGAAFDQAEPWDDTHSLPQCGRAPKGASASSTAGRASRITRGASLIHVKWMAITSRPYAGESHQPSAATTRSSDTCSRGCSTVPIARSAASAAGASCRRTKYSLCSSSPRLLGDSSARKCGRRSCHGPGTPCSVHAAGGIALIGCILRRASFACEDGTPNRRT